MNKEFPEHWISFDLKDICFFQEGPGLRNWQYREKGTKFINIRCIKNGYLDTSIAQFISSDEVENKYNHFLLNEGDYVLSSSGTIGRIAVVGKYDLPLLLNTSVIRFRTLDESKLDKKYLFYFLQSKQFYKKILEQSQGSAQVNFGPSHLKLLHASFPPIHEQKKIAEILSLIDIQIGLLEQKRTKIKNLFYAMLGQHFNYWEGAEIQLHKIASLQSGGTPSRTNKSFWNGSVPWVKTGEINYNNIKVTEESISIEGLNNSSAKIMPVGTILMAMYGQGVTRGRVARLSIPAATNQACLAINSKSDTFLNDYIYFCLCSKYEKLRSYVQEGSQKNLSKSIIEKIYIPELNFQEQINLVNKFKLIEEMLLKYNLIISKHRLLKQSISDELLSGRKRINI
ncbi:restriction endonuclease subunit S [Prochlorococcus sp. AH-716-P05]|nr:restriction endonuclease subunit S [Prochlorococcus sp. AH-716-P05]